MATPASAEAFADAELRRLVEAIEEVADQEARAIRNSAYLLVERNIAKPDHIARGRLYSAALRLADAVRAGKIKI